MNANFLPLLICYGSRRFARIWNLRINTVAGDGGGGKQNIIGRRIEKGGKLKEVNTGGVLMVGGTSGKAVHMNYILNKTYLLWYVPLFYTFQMSTSMRSTRFQVRLASAVRACVSICWSTTLWLCAPDLQDRIRSGVLKLVSGDRVREMLKNIMKKPNNDIILW